MILLAMIKKKNGGKGLERESKEFNFCHVQFTLTSSERGVTEKSQAGGGMRKVGGSERIF